MTSNLTRAGQPSAAKDPSRAGSPDAGQVFSTFVRTLEKLGKGTKQKPHRAKGKAR
jgi:hypothetical protein